MSKKIEWKGGHLDVYFAWPGGVRPIPEMSGDYRRIGDGLAVPNRPLTATIDEPEGLRGIVLEFDLRGDRLACVKITSSAEGTLEPELMRKLGPMVRQAAIELLEESVVRLIEVDGKPAGELAWQRTAGGVQFGVTADDVKAGARRRNKPRLGRPPIPDATLERVAALYLEAEQLGVPRTAYIAAKFPNYSDETIRNWVRRARERGKLPPVKPARKRGRP